MNEIEMYEIIETKYQPKKQAKLDFLETFEEAKKRALEEAGRNIGVRYAIFCQGSVIAEFQAYYRTTITRPNCGEVIPIE